MVNYLSKKRRSDDEKNNSFENNEKDTVEGERANKNKDEVR
jgi:hypothetical protein